MSASRSIGIALAIYVAVTLIAPIVRGTVRGPLADHAIIVVVCVLLFALPLLLRSVLRCRRRS